MRWPSMTLLLLLPLSTLSIWQRENLLITGAAMGSSLTSVTPSLAASTQPKRIFQLLTTLGLHKRRILRKILRTCMCGSMERNLQTTVIEKPFWAHTILMLASDLLLMTSG